MLGIGNSNDVDGRRHGERLASSLRRQKVVELGHEGNDASPGCLPYAHVIGGSEPQRRAQQDDTANRVDISVLENDIGAERPPHQPDVRQSPPVRFINGRPQVQTLAHGTIEFTFAGTGSRGGAAGVEAQHCDVGHGW